MIEQMTVQETAKAMGKPEQFVRMGLRQGVFPWGYAVKMAGQYAYFVNKKMFEQIEKGGIEHEKCTNLEHCGHCGSDDNPCHAAVTN